MLSALPPPAPALCAALAGRVAAACLRRSALAALTHLFALPALTALTALAALTALTAAADAAPAAPRPDVAFCSAQDL